MVATSRTGITWDTGGPIDRACAKLGIDYKPREVQRRMADVITAALSRQAQRSGQILPIEAATGTGKTLAYLVPCALNAARARERMLVSTQTIALGNQIMAREGPTAQEVVASMMGHRPQIAHIRGRRHFLSPSRTRAVANLMEDNVSDRRR